MQGTRVNLEQPLYYDFVTKGMVFHAPQPDISDLCVRRDGNNMTKSTFDFTP